MAVLTQPTPLQTAAVRPFLLPRLRRAPRLGPACDATSGLIGAAVVTYVVPMVPARPRPKGKAALRPVRKQTFPSRPLNGPAAALVSLTGPSAACLFLPADQLVRPAAALAADVARRAVGASPAITARLSALLAIETYLAVVVARLIFARPRPGLRPTRRLPPVRKRQSAAAPIGRQRPLAVLPIFAGGPALRLAVRLAIVLPAALTPCPVADLLLLRRQAATPCLRRPPCRLALRQPSSAAGPSPLSWSTARPSTLALWSSKTPSPLAGPSPATLWRPPSPSAWPWPLSPSSL